MSEKKKWMPSEEEISLAVFTDDKEHECGRPNTADLIRRTGLRAQVVALEGLIAGHEGSAMVDQAKAMIEELRREIG